MNISSKTGWWPHIIGVLSAAGATSVFFVSAHVITFRDRDFGLVFAINVGLASIMLLVFYVIAVVILRKQWWLVCVVVLIWMIIIGAIVVQGKRDSKRLSKPAAQSGGAIMKSVRRQPLL